MLITWLKGRVRVKGDTYTKEIEGYRCSGCNNFQEQMTRKCQSCGGEFVGKIVNKK